MDNHAFADATLDPPGKIVVIGAGPVGIEAALYGRFLGYNVILLEADEVGHSMRERLDEPFPMMPHESLSPLAIAAIETQSSDSMPLTLPMTYRQWIDRALLKLAECDLLHDRLEMPCRVQRIELVAVEAEETDADDIPPDFRLWVETKSDTSGHAASPPIDTEAVFIATGKNCEIEFEFTHPQAYFFRLGEPSTETTNETPAEYLARCRLEISRAFARLGGRTDLDLYRPRRV